MVRIVLSFYILAGFISSTLFAESLNVAVTASFKPVLEELEPLFKQAKGHDLVLSSASTGTLYQQIRHGAPFDIFLAADDLRPKQLQQFLKLPIERVFLYATGQLVLVSKDPSIKQLEDLKQSPHQLVVANPAVAPFGVAAEEVLSSIGYQGEKVFANNVSQAQQYLNLGLSPVGIVSASVATELPHIKIDSALYKPVIQQGIVLTDSTAAQEFVLFLASQEVTELYLRFGYSLPVSSQ
ncbi:molybdate ABC transporter substrate-binding protein [Reinekea sp.]|jgi:molybdate transport system substrate-binding protein|uniref:molybdate ABC transporter substrate-binding protein n=1 Tax=Reinekea sp. TaxID=1970455 RepID=UPI00398929F7